MLLVIFTPLFIQFSLCQINFSFFLWRKKKHTHIHTSGLLVSKYYAVPIKRYREINIIKRGKTVEWMEFHYFRISSELFWIDGVHICVRVETAAHFCILRISVTFYWVLIHVFELIDSTICWSSGTIQLQLRRAATWVYRTKWKKLSLVRCQREQIHHGIKTELQHGISGV